MRRESFTSIFWGLLFVVLDIRIGPLDLFLPDFIGYLLIFKGLSLLAPEHRGFRRARILAAVMSFVSLPNLIEVESAPVDSAFFKRQLLSGLTGNLSALFPEKIQSAKLLRTTNSRSSIDAGRTQNPQRDEDAELGEYSDGTVVLILRYASPEEARRALDHIERIILSKRFGKEPRRMSRSGRSICPAQKANPVPRNKEIRKTGALKRQTE